MSETIPVNYSPWPQLMQGYLYVHSLQYTHGKGSW